MVGLDEFRVKHEPQSVAPFLREIGTHVATLPGCREFPCLLGSKRVSGGAVIGESGDGGDDDGNLMQSAQAFGSFLVGDRFAIEAEVS
jgi:hypothetical protein